MNKLEKLTQTLSRACDDMEWLATSQGEKDTLAMLQDMLKEAKGGAFSLTETQTN